MPARPPQGRRSGSAPKKSDAGRQDKVVALLTPVVRAVGLELEDVEMRMVGRRLVLRVLVDSDRGISLDEVATASTSVSDALDGSTVLGDEPFTLEVSSPGVDRPLTLPRHWQRSVGRLVTVIRDGGPEVTGRITSLTDTEVTLEIDEKGRKRSVVVALSDVTRAVVQVEFSRVAVADLGDEADVDDEPDDTDDPDDPDDPDDTDDHAGDDAAETEA